MTERQVEVGVFRRDRKLDELVRFAKEPLDLDLVDEDDPYWRYDLEPLVAAMEFEFNPDQPRDDQGRWVGEGGGTSGKPEEDGKGPLRTNDVKEAAKALAEGREVILEQPDEIATLIDELGRQAAEAQRMGLAAPKIDLGKVSVEGTNLF